LIVSCVEAKERLTPAHVLAVVDEACRDLPADAKAQIALVARPNTSGENAQGRLIWPTGDDCAHERPLFGPVRRMTARASSQDQR
jgi:hypothetical protein